jgi:gliding motility-associated-like protein
MDRADVGELTATSQFEGSTFNWEKFDTISGTFDPFTGNIQFDTLSSTISGLDDGLYRVNINAGGNIIPPYQAYVFNNWVEITKAEIPDSSSTCEGFKIEADYKAAPMRYFDPNTNSIKSLRNSYDSFIFSWKKGSEIVPGGIVLSPYIFPPLADKNQIFTLTVTDPFKCQSQSSEGNVEYISKVPKSVFTADPMTGEAVLKVTFKNSSINYDSTIWCFYKPDSLIKVEIEVNKGKPIDSIDFVLFENAPVYEYEWCGKYRVKLVTVHVNPTTGNCYDTLYMKEPINVEESLVEVPNVFTPNGDTKNDEFVVKTKSLLSMSVHIYNRWGGLVHSWSYSNIRSRDYTYEKSVWDGKIGSRMASPGVYFYVIKAVGRDGHKQTKNGFVHLFRTKD